jgi:transcriptional regulator with XRE-family HTH domain
MRECQARRKRFRAALALAGKDAKDFATAAGVTAPHLSLVLHGKRESAVLVQKVDAFIARYLGDSVTVKQPTSASAA